MKHAIFKLLSFVALAVALPAGATIIRVGAAWGTRADYATLQAFIDAGTHKAATDSVWIAGEHQLTAQWYVSGWQCSLFGGFAGTERSVDERAKEAGGYAWNFANPTTLSLVAGLSGQHSLIVGLNAVNGGETLPLIDGITFDGSNCTATPLWFRQYSSPTLTIRNCIVRGSSLPTDNTLNPGIADFIAGGIQLGSDDASNVGQTTIENCLIENCSARVGGVVARKATLRNCYILNNSGADSDKAGGLYAYGATTLDGCVFWNNTVGSATSTMGKTSSATITATNNRVPALNETFTAANGNSVISSEAEVYKQVNLAITLPDGVTTAPELPAVAYAGSKVAFALNGVPSDYRVIVTVGSDTLSADASGQYAFTAWTDATILVSLAALPTLTPSLVSTGNIDWQTFLAPHDMYWTSITADPTDNHNHFGRKTGYYASALMGNGLLGSMFYKLRNNVYRLNVGRSDVTEQRNGGYLLYNSGRLPIGYFTLSTVGTVSEERMRLSLYDAVTKGQLTTNKGSIHFTTYVQANKNCIVFETSATGDETGYKWDFVPLQAVSPRYIKGMGDTPKDYVNSAGKSNPDPYTRTEGEYHYLIQPLAADTTFSTINKYYVVGWKIVDDGASRRIIATVSLERTLALALRQAKADIDEGFAQTSTALQQDHKSWWHNFYHTAAFLTFPSGKYESYYWAQYYKFASTARSGKPIVDLQGVWPTYDTPWPAIWMNLNIQLTYSWLTKANLAQLEQPLWDSFWEHRDNLQRNVTDISSQSTWTDSRCMPRTATYDLHAPLSPSGANNNTYEVGNLTWTLFYYWQQCVAYGDTAQIKEKLFPLLKSAVNLFFHIRTKSGSTYGLPATASPEYVSTNIGTNTNYDLSNLRWGLQALIDIDTTYHMNDPMLSQWQDFLNNLVDYPYSESTGFKVSDKYEFTDTSHRHYSHLFMIYPYHLLDWDDPTWRSKMEFSVNRWNGNQGYSRTGKAAMLATKGDGDGALAQMDLFLSNFLRPNTLYNESGPVIETPLAGVSSLHEFYMQDWGSKIRVFNGCPSSWQEASFINMRAKGAFLVSANRSHGRTTLIQVESEQGGLCRLQTGIPAANIVVKNLDGSPVAFQLADAATGLIEVNTSKGQIFQVFNRTLDPVQPAPISHSAAEANPFGDGTHTTLPVLRAAFNRSQVELPASAAAYTADVTTDEGTDLAALDWTSGDAAMLYSQGSGHYYVKSAGQTWIAFSDPLSGFTDTCRVSIAGPLTTAYLEPSDDAYTYKGGPTVNYGSSTTAIVRRESASSSFARNSYFRFALSPDLMPDSNFSATLSLYVVKTGKMAGTVRLQAYSTGTAWSEGTVTWATQPDTLGLVAELPGYVKSGEAYVDTARLLFDVTPYVLSALRGDSAAVSFFVTQSHRATSGQGTTTLATKEAADGRTMPYLVLCGLHVADAMDHNADGSVNLPDAVMVIAKVSAGDQTNLSAYDHNADGTIDLPDAVAILDRIAAQ